MLYFLFNLALRKKHSTITAAMNITESFDKKLQCIALFIDLLKAFDMVDHIILRDY